ncbi:MAG TPA: tetratricopeptide repeat protein, partial [Candidatus Hydrogenedentes bacterium]|nr:tetratricopeptide repeat protein [Candidatus Hydrogenedentota bacterium]
AVQELLRHDPDNFLARMYRANQAMRATDYQAAVDELNIALRTKPENGNAWFLLGQCRVAMGFPELAESAYRKGLEMDPNDPWPAMGLAGVLETQGRLEEARQAVQEALRRAPNLRAAQEKLKNWGD